jgi:hypothetical protein
MNKFFSKLFGAFFKSGAGKEVCAKSCVKATKNGLNYLYSPKTNQTYVRNLAKKTTTVLNGEYPLATFNRSGLKCKNLADMGNSSVNRIVNAGNRTITYRNPNAVLPYPTYANSTVVNIG